MKNFSPSKCVGRMKEIRSKGLRATIAEHGIVDLASIMVGVIIVGILSTGIVATVFVLIPWVQNEAAKQALDSVRTAEAAAYVSGADSSTGSQYLPLDQLAAGDWIQASDNILVGIDDEATCWAAISKSDTGTMFWAEDTSGETLVYEAGVSASSCVNLDTLAASDLSAPWVFADSGLRNQITSMLGLADGAELTLADAASIPNGSGGALDFMGVTSAAGLEKATGITEVPTIYGSSLVNSAGFDNITTVFFDLDLDGLSLTELDGFPALTSVGGDIRISSNDSLVSINGFEQLATVGGGVEISHNFKLSSIESFGALSTVGAGVHIENDWELSSITGFSALTTVQEIEIVGSTVLTSVNGFEALTTVETSIEIWGSYDSFSISGFQVLEDSAIYVDVQLSGGPATYATSAAELRAAAN